MPNIGGIVKSLQNIMWKDPGVSGDAQRLEQLGWMITLKILDDKDAEMELLNDDFVSVIPSELQWRNWAADSEGMTGDELKDFVDKFVEVFKIEHMTYEDAAYAESTAGWYSAFKYMCENNDLNDVVDYYDNLPWYESDLFDDKLTGLLMKYDLLEDSGYEKFV